MSSPVRPSAALFIWPTLVAAVAWLYWPGLQSSWLLDDYPNFGDLSLFGNNPTFGDLIAYTFTGLGRPLAKLSFGLQHASWPTHPEDFKALNLALHLFNGFLIWRLALLLSEPRNDDKGVNVPALLAAALWLTNPLQVSTVLYAVQRMTEMASFFILSGLVIWIHVRRTGRLLPQAAALWGFGLLALACKENGVLILVYALALAHTLLPRPTNTPRWHEVILLWLPLAAAVSVVAWHFDSWVIQRYAERPFSLEERLLSQPRALLDYLKTAFIPTPSGLGVYQDDWPASTNFWTPWSTLPAIWALTIALGFALWRRTNFTAFAILWFLAGHALESTIIPLELYFNHRNYLALFGPLLALSHFAAQRRLTLALLIGWGCLVAFLTHTEAQIWGQPELQARAWLREHPQSPRSAEQLANILARQGRYAEAAPVFHQLDRLLPHGNAIAALSIYHLSCEDPTIATPRGLNSRLAKDICGISTINAMVALTQAVETHHCAHSEDILSFTNSLIENPSCAGQVPDLLVIKGRLEVAGGNLDEGLVSLKKSYQTHPYPPTAMLMARYLFETGDIGRTRSALRLAEHANLRQPMFRRRAFEWQITTWKKKLNTNPGGTNSHR